MKHPSSILVLVLGFLSWFAGRSLGEEKGERLLGKNIVVAGIEKTVEKGAAITLQGQLKVSTKKPLRIGGNLNAECREVIWKEGVAELRGCQWVSTGEIRHAPLDQEAVCFVYENGRMDLRGPWRTALPKL